MGLSVSGRDGKPGGCRQGPRTRGWPPRGLAFQIAFQIHDQMRFGFSGRAEDQPRSATLQFCVWILQTTRNGGKGSSSSLLQSASPAKLHTATTNPPCLMGLIRRPKSEGDPLRTGLASLFHIHTVGSAKRGKTDADEVGVDDNTGIGGGPSGMANHPLLSATTATT